MTKLALPNPKEVPVFVNVSGGKDSAAVCLHLTEQGIPHRRVFADTGWEHEDTYKYLDYLETVLGPIDRVKPAMPMPDMIRQKGMFPNFRQRWCTAELKVRPLNDYMAKEDPYWDAIVAVGIRADESTARAGLDEWEHDGNAMERWVWRPIIRWTLADVIAIHKRHNLTPNPLYLRGANRVGCWPCIYARKNEIRMVANESPERIDLIRDLEKELAERMELKKQQDPEFRKRAEEKRYRNPTFFNPKGGMIPIDEVVRWSRTKRGGYAIELVDPNPERGCLRWGMCDRGDTETED